MPFIDLAKAMTEKTRNEIGRKPEQVANIRRYPGHTDLTPSQVETKQGLLNDIDKANKNLASRMEKLISLLPEEASQEDKDKVWAASREVLGGHTDAPKMTLEDYNRGTVSLAFALEAKEQTIIEKFAVNKADITGIKKGNPSPEIPKDPSDPPDGGPPPRGGGAALPLPDRAQDADVQRGAPDQPGGLQSKFLNQSELLQYLPSNVRESLLTETPSKETSPEQSKALEDSILSQYLTNKMDVLGMERRGPEPPPPESRYLEYDER